MRYRLAAASVVTAAALLFAPGSVATEPLPGVDRRLAVDVGFPPWNAIAKILVSGGAPRLPLIAPSRRIDRLCEWSGSERGCFPLGGRIGVKRRALAWLAP
jgi:hypothetical protein